MKHYLFQRDIFGTTMTIEINGGEPCGSVNGRPLFYAIRIHKGITPHWSYQAGFDAPAWCDAFNYGYATRPGEHSNIKLLRMVVAYLTGNTWMIPHNPKLGFHSKYKAMKRRERDAARLAA